MTRASRKKVPSPRLQCELLEPRLLLAADAAELTALLVEDGHPIGCCCPGCGVSLPPPLAADRELGPSTGPTGGSPSGTTYSLSSIPALNSLPGARATLYLDFNGHYDSVWGGYADVTTPAFDQDGDPTTFSEAELAAIEQVWRYVAEDYAPFQINVTTVEPSSFDNGQGLRAAIGGDGLWLGFRAGGVAYVNTFTNGIVNTVYVFPKNLANGHAKYVAEASSHEAGHGFGLDHQSHFSGAAKIAEYYGGPGDGRAPIMGASYSATRGLWWNGADSYHRAQDDMAVIARSANGFGYRPDDHGDTPASATALAVSGNRVSASGVISATSDVDCFSFSTGEGTISLTVSVPPYVNNLDSRLELRDASGTLITSAAPGGSFGATISGRVPAGTYYLVVASQGGYGDVGQYTVSGTIGAPSLLTKPAGPTSLMAVGVSKKRIDLNWQDNSDNETGFVILRSANNGRSWKSIGQVRANVRSFSDTRVLKGKKYSYRVYATSPGVGSADSNVASVTAFAPSKAKASRIVSASVDSQRSAPAQAGRTSATAESAGSDLVPALLVDQVFAGRSHRRGGW